MAGVADAVRDAGIACFGPSKAAAQLEGSKAFAKDVMAAAGVPTAAARVCETAEEVAAALGRARVAVRGQGRRTRRRQGGGGDHRSPGSPLDHAASCGRVVIEEFLDGPEVSLFAITDGTTVVPLQPAQDFKRAYDDDAGPNTGGMGAYTPLPWAPDDLVEEVLRTVLQPTVDELARRGTPFSGLLYAGLALTGRGVRVIEFNARFGDPETQPLLARLKHPARRAAVRRGDRHPGRPAAAGVDGRLGGGGRAGRGELPGEAGHRRGDRRASTPAPPDGTWSCTPAPDWTPRAG